jgi:tetratricopeptide (TPR) repeat protein
LSTVAVTVALAGAAGCAARTNRNDVHSERASGQAPGGTAEAAASGAAAPAQPEVISLLGRPLYAMPAGAQRDEFESKLAAAGADLARAPDDPDKLIWVGRWLGYMWRTSEAIAVYSDGIQRFPECAELYRHRGHRYITIRQFKLAEGDLRQAARLIAGRPDRVEADGLPNALNIPLTTTAFNVWYHLGVASYLQADFAGAAEAFTSALQFTGGRDDNLVAASDWLYLSLRRQGRHEEAAALLSPITSEMTIIENHGYHRRLLLYKGALQESDLLGTGGSAVEQATQAYGVGCWHLCEGRRQQAGAVFEQIVTGDSWPAFGFIAAEAELARVKQGPGFQVPSSR